MADDASFTIPADPDHRSRWFWIFLFLTGSLASTILLKVASIQYLELIYAFQIALLLVLLFTRGLKFRLIRPCATLGVLYLVFICAAVALSIAARRNDFFLPNDLDLLKRPLWITVSRVAELIIDAGIMIYLVQVFCASHTALVFTLKVYFWCGVASAVYSILSYPLSFLGIAEFGVYSIFHRTRGFYNEAGPYGLYVISVFLVGLALYNHKWSNRKHLRIALVLLAIALLGSQSKAAAFAILTMLLLNALLVQSLSRRLIVVAALVLAGFVLNTMVDIRSTLELYQRNTQRYERVSHLVYGDANYVIGRVAGAFLVPRMIAAHPLTGVGWGNYGLVRNDPEYRGGSAWVDVADQPELGIFGITAELGIPLTLFLLCCLLYPYLYLRRIGAPLYLKNLVLLQPLVHAFGGQLNLTYPWVTTAFALALGYLYSRSTLTSPAVPEPSVPSPSPISGIAALPLPRAGA